jgi:hypothetical protein
MPAQAPADPLFYQNQRNAAYAQEAVDFNQRVAAREQLNRLQRQAPVLQAQQAQLAYDNIAKEANDLRKKQEIEAQVERAASELAGGNLNPESDDFAVKYRDLATRNPLAFSDPRFSTVAGLYENQYKGYQQAKQQRAEAEAIAAKARMEAENAAYAFGVPAGTITPEMGEREIAIERGKVKATGTRGTGTRGVAKDIAGQMMQKDYELVGSRLKAMADEGKNVLYDKDGAEIPNPKFDELAKEHDRLFNELRGSYQGIYNPAEAAPATQQLSAPRAISVNPAGARFSPESLLPQDSLPASVMASALPQVQAPVPITPEGQIDIDKIPFDEIDNNLKQVIEQSKAQEEASKVWNAAQMDLQKKLEKLYPGNFAGTNYAKLSRFAKAVLDDELMKDTGKDIVLDEEGQPLRVLVGQSALEKLGLPPEGDAFTEPGKARKSLFGLIGDQRVPYKELLRTWAKNYLERAPTTVQPTLPAISQENAVKKTNLLKSVGIGANG